MLTIIRASKYNFFIIILLFNFFYSLPSSSGRALNKSDTRP